MADERMFLKYYCVTFLDILGQQEQLDALRVPPTPENRENIVRALKNTVGAIQELREALKTYYDTQQHHDKSRLRNPLYHLLTIDQKLGIRRATLSQVKFQHFSDAVVMYSPLTDPGGQAQVNDVLHALTAAATAMTMFLAGKRPLRGGIELGNAIEWREGEIYGPALKDAYLMECRLAKYPRILVGPNAIEYLHHVTKDPLQGLVNELRHALAREALSLIAKDEDGRQFVDFLGQGMRRISGGCDFSDVVRAAVCFVDAEYARFGHLGETELTDRYRRLREYCHCRAFLWT